jgi:hypothetical protein
MQVWVKHLLTQPRIVKLALSQISSKSYVVNGVPVSVRLSSSQVGDVLSTKDGGVPYLKAVVYQMFLAYQQELNKKGVATGSSPNVQLLSPPDLTSGVGLYTARLKSPLFSSAMPVATAQEGQLEVLDVADGRYMLEHVVCTCKTC